MADLCGLASAHVMTIWPSDLPALAVFLPRMPAVAGSVVRDGGFFRGDLRLNPTVATAGGDGGTASSATSEPEVVGASSGSAAAASEASMALSHGDLPESLAILGLRSGRARAAQQMPGALGAKHFVHRPSGLENLSDTR